MKLKPSTQQTNETINRANRKPKDGRKIFGICASDKVLTSRIYEELQNLNTETTMLPINKGANEMNGHSSKKETQMNNKCFSHAQHPWPSGKFKLK